MVINLPEKGKAVQFKRINEEGELEVFRTGNMADLQSFCAPFCLEYQTDMGAFSTIIF